jgi:hypothetical protein
MSHWASFAHPLQFSEAAHIVNENASLARALSAQQKHSDSVEPVRKAMQYTKFPRLARKLSRVLARHGHHDRRDVAGVR